MKLKAYNIFPGLAVLLFINLNSFAQPNKNPNDDNFTGPTKNYTKSYVAGAGDKLRIENVYGKITVNTWDKNEFKVDVQIKISAKNANEQKMLDNITINDNKTGSTVSFKTNIGNLGTNGVHKMVINYTVYMPSKNALDIDAEYGSVELPNLDGKVVIDESYGMLTAKTLSNAANNIKLSYSNAKIEKLSTCKISAEYSQLDLGSADQLTGDFSYSSAKIGKLNTSGTFSLSYSPAFTIADLDKNFKKLSSTAEYSNIKLGLGGDKNANFDITIENGGFKYDSHKVNIISKTPPDNARGWSPTKNYKGTLGKGDASKMISINASYGNVTFN